MTEIKAPVLSISMLVSNGRKDTIQKCMESLVSLRKAVPSELVLVDTGCIDGSIEIARKYADKVVRFNWCDDFSAARNAGLFACTGEWFLYLDDDEWFEDTSEIAQFFVSGEYKNYDGAWYIVRNYDDFDGKKYTNTYVGRVIPLTKETKFVGKVHEWISPSPCKIKYLSSFVHHYGYVFQTEEERRKHFERNLILEEAAVAENPEDIRMCCQLVQEYRAAGRFDDAERLCKETLEKKLYPESNYFVQYLLTCIPKIHSEQKKYREALEEYDALEASGKLTYLAKLFCLYEKMYLYGILGEDEKFRLEAEDYIKSRENASEDIGYPVMDFMSYVSDRMYQRVVENGIKVIFRLKDFAKAKFFFDRIDWADAENPREECMQLLLFAYQETENTALFLDTAEKISKVSALRRKWCIELKRFLDAYVSVEQTVMGPEGIDGEFSNAEKVSKGGFAQENFKGNAKRYTQAAGSVPIIIPVLRVWMKDMELEILSRQMHDIIVAQRKAGNIAEAEKLLSEVENMLPGEGWIQEIRNKEDKG